MTPIEILLSVSAIGLTAGAITYTVNVVRNAPVLERPNAAQVARMIETAPRGKFDNALAR